MRSRASMVGLVLLAAASWPAAAQQRCPEGRTLQGTCANAVLGQVMRQGTIIGSQPKISLTAPLNLPSQDAYFATLRTQQRYETIRFYNPFILRAGPRGEFAPPAAITQP